MRLVADRLQACNALLQRRVVEIGNAGLDGVIEPHQPQIGLGRPLVQLGDVLAAALSALLPAIEDRRQDFLEPLRLEQTIGDVLRDEVVELLHGDRPAFAAGLALPRLDRAGVVAIPPSLPGPERHRAAAVGAETNAGKEGWTTDDARRRDLRIAAAQMRLHRIERRLINQRRYLDGDDLAHGLQHLVLGALVELMPANVRRPRQNAVDLANTPAPAVAGEDAAPIQVRRDILHAHRPANAVAFQCEAIDQPNRLGVQRVDFELLLDLRAALLGRDDAVADRRQGAVPEALPRVLLKARKTCLAFSFDWYSSNSAMICRIMTCIGPSPISCVIDTSLTPFFASLRT